MRGALALALLALPGCKLFAKPGRILVREGTSSATTRVLAEHVDGKGEDVIDVGAHDALPYPNGAGVLAVDASNTGFLRHEKGRTGVVTCTTTSMVNLFAIDDAGDHVLFRTSAGKTETVHFMDLRSCAETKLEVRYAFRGDVARDGSEAAIGALPTTCAAPSMNDCPVTLFRLRPAGSPVPTEVLRAGPRAHYQPRYFPDGRLVFQTTELDASCDGTINGCRHDLVSLPISGGPGSPLVTIRKGAIAASVSLDGKKIAYLAYTGADTTCHARLPCYGMTLKVGDAHASDDAKDTAVAVGTVSNVPGRAFSLDGKWIAFATGHDSEPELCRTDGTHCKSFAGKRLLGWVR